ncbi:VOC family protein [Nocardioides jiangxiensis]|uniref:VOC family protein n=1 Tax=Nocardioides jiangxiensis TaxID=3064524 RepID=A0ABT9AXA3_9ACTN|nr:VOC family protein [Nocardioides sp. WY-20]MDO7867054.1 VOC family protein [Nocardioides sp. WY-20]
MTISKIAVAMFSVADQDAAVAYYTGTLGWEVRSDVSFGEGDQAGRWVEVAPPGSDARLALNPPMNGEPGGGAIGVETPDVDATRAVLEAAGATLGEPMGGDGTVPRMFSVTDPDGNWIWVVQER